MAKHFFRSRPTSVLSPPPKADRSCATRGGHFTCYQHITRISLTGQGRMWYKALARFPELFIRFEDHRSSGWCCKWRRGAIERGRETATPSRRLYPNKPSVEVCATEGTCFSETDPESVAPCQELHTYVRFDGFPKHDSAQHREERPIKSGCSVDAPSWHRVCILP
jgi:hypothetical protein